MHIFLRIVLISCAILFSFQKVFSQCSIFVDTVNIVHINCNGSANGSASLIQTPYINYSWDNITNGLNYGSGPMVTSVSTLDAGFYVVTGTIPLSSVCPPSMTSDTFEITEPTPLNLSNVLYKISSASKLKILLININKTNILNFLTIVKFIIFFIDKKKE